MLQTMASITLTNRFLQRTPPTTTVMTPPSTTRRLPKPPATSRSRSQWTCRKKDIHPEFYSEAKVYCNGELVLTTGGTQEEYKVDVWSGNHPFYLGKRTALVFDGDQLEKFRRRFGELTHLMEIPVLKGELVIPPQRPSKGGKKK
ncbi:hypothetical protein Dimus_026048 [Dionaea muscipula]